MKATPIKKAPDWWVGEKVECEKCQMVLTIEEDDKPVNKDRIMPVFKCCYCGKRVMLDGRGPNF